MADDDQDDWGNDVLAHRVLKAELAKLKARVSSLADRIDALEKEAPAGDSTPGGKISRISSPR